MTSRGSNSESGTFGTFVDLDPKTDLAEVEDQEFKGNWTGVYILRGGFILRHTPWRMDINRMVFAEKELSLDEPILVGKRVFIPPAGSLHVSTNSTQEEFESALRKSGLWG